MGKRGQRKAMLKKIISGRQTGTEGQFDIEFLGQIEANIQVKRS